VANSSFHLFQLQKIDLQIDSLNKRMSEIEAIRNDNSMRQKIESELNNKKATYSLDQKKYKDIEERVLVKKLKMEQSEASLYGGTIKNPKELQDLQAEIKSLKQSISILEDEQLQQLMTLESSEKNKDNIEQELQVFDVQLEKEFSSLFSEESEKKILLEKLSHERKAILDQISAEDLMLYQSLRKNKKGIAVALIEDSTCAACGSTLTPADCQAAKSSIRVVFCSSCGRIIYAG
jgi:uncharacterized protein